MPTRKLAQLFVSVLLIAIPSACSVGKTTTIGNATSSKRVALVIGNGAYRTVPELKNPVADGQAIAALLERLGYDTHVFINADRASMVNAITTFGRLAADADAAVIYYAGHAVDIGGAQLPDPDLGFGLEFCVNPTGERLV